MPLMAVTDLLPCCRYAAAAAVRRHEMLRLARFDADVSEEFAAGAAAAVLATVSDVVQSVCCRHHE